MPHTTLEKFLPGWQSWRRVSHLARRLGEATAPAAELVTNDCFGRVAEEERLALEGLIAGEPCQAEPTTAEPPDHDPTDRVG